jgi:hypothetical protein
MWTVASDDGKDSGWVQEQARQHGRAQGPLEFLMMSLTIQQFNSIRGRREDRLHLRGGRAAQCFLMSSASLFAL